MYGAAGAVTEDFLVTMHANGSPFLATKAWTNGKDAGITQMQQSMNPLLYQYNNTSLFVKLKLKIIEKIITKMILIRQTAMAAQVKSGDNQ